MVPQLEIPGTCRYVENRRKMSFFDRFWLSDSTFSVVHTYRDINCIITVLTKSNCLHVIVKCSSPTADAHGKVKLKY